MVQRFWTALPLILLITLSGCIGNSNSTATASITPSVSPTGSLPPEDADTLVYTPAGVIVYKGNMNGVNLVPTVTMDFIDGTDIIHITYRAYIVTRAGRTRNDIISIIDSDNQIKYNQIGPPRPGQDQTTFSFSVSGLPTGITADTSGPIVFHISPGVKPGQYTFQINVQINVQINAATHSLPCTIKVT